VCVCVCSKVVMEKVTLLEEGERGQSNPCQFDSFIHKGIRIHSAENDLKLEKGSLTCYFLSLEMPLSLWLFVY